MLISPLLLKFFDPNPLQRMQHLTGPSPALWRVVENYRRMSLPAIPARVGSCERTNPISAATAPLPDAMPSELPRHPIANIPRCWPLPRARPHWLRVLHSDPRSVRARTQLGNVLAAATELPSVSPVEPGVRVALFDRAREVASAVYTPTYGYRRYRRANQLLYTFST